MEAIPSLCASTASCGIAAIGYALAQPASSGRFTPDESVNGGRFTALTPSTFRHHLSPTSTPPTQSRAFLRSSSATDPALPTFERKFPPYRAASEGKISLDREGDRPGTQAEIKREGSEDNSIRKRASWVRRLSTVTPSLDGSFASPSLYRPSTPSVFSNGSNAPLFSNPTPVTPRNKLVKRSTSQRILHSGSPSTTPLPTRNATFRRPATSYQRSEELRLHTAQQSIGLTEKTSQTLSQPPHGLNDSDRNPGASLISLSQWRPFFRYRRKKFGLEAPTRRASFSKVLGGSDHICCVDTRLGLEPVLVVGTLVRKPEMNISDSFDSPLRPLEESDSDVEDRSTRAPAARGERKSRSSFSLGDLMPSSSPSGKRVSRGGSLKRKKGREHTATSRRIVSAPQQSGLESTKPNVIILHASETGKPSRKLNSFGGSSPPLPPFEQFSAFEVDLPGTSSSNRTESMLEEQGHSSYQDSPLARVSSNHGGSASVRVRSQPNRSSRVPSDHSTTFGSDNEQSRVFSTDGEDGEFRSETAYDSLRTDASGSSHSGARSHRVDTVFGDQTPPEAAKQNPSAFQEKLSRIPLMGYRKHEDFIAEEESVTTPTQRQKPSEAEDRTAGSLAHHDASSNASSSLSHNTNRLLHQSGFERDTESAGWAEKNQISQAESMPNIVEDDWDEELGIEPDSTVRANQAHFAGSLVPAEPLSSNSVSLAQRPKSNIFEWSERQPPEKGSGSGSSPRPRTAHPQQAIDRGGRPSGRRPAAGVHLRSQSVPLPPENTKHRFNNSAKLDSWKLGGKGDNEKWDNDFEFDEPSPAVQDTASEITLGEGVVVPKEILEKQASVHGQFGQVRELSLLVEELRRLHHQASIHGLLTGQSSGLWREAEGIIDLATLDEDEPPRSPNSTSFDFDASFDEDSPNVGTRTRKTSAARSRRGSLAQKDTSPATQSALFPSPVSSRQGTPKGRPRQDSVARAKNVLETINQHRSALDPPLESAEESTPSSSPSKKMPFDTTSLRDLVIRAGVVTRALKEVIRRAEDPDYIPKTPERRSASPPDPPFVTHIFHHASPQSSPSPSNDRKSPPVAEKTGGSLSVGPLSPHSVPTHETNEVHGHGHTHGPVHMMTVV